MDKNFNVGHNFQTIKDSYHVSYSWVFLMTRSFTWYRNFWSCDLDVWPTFEKLDVGHNFQTRRDREFILQVLVTRSFAWYHNFNLEAKQKYQRMLKIGKSGNKTSSGEIGLNIRTLASPNVRQDQVYGWVSVLCWHAAPVANVLWKPHKIR